MPILPTLESLSPKSEITPLRHTRMRKVNMEKDIVTDEAFCLEKGVKFEKCVSVLQNMVLKSWSNRWMI